MTAHLDAWALGNELRAFLRGEVYFDDTHRALYATDASNYRQVPIGVVRPKDNADVEKALEICRSHGAPVLSRGSGTSLAGQCCNEAVVFDFRKHMNRILEIDPVAKTARVQPGVVLDDLQAALKPHGLIFGPDPATHNRCTFGGMIGNNACGVHSVMSGKTVDNVESLEVVTYDGTRLTIGKNSEDDIRRQAEGPGRKAEIFRGLKELREKYLPFIRRRYPRLPRRVSGYNLDELLPENHFNLARALVGTEGTCAVVLEATVRLIPNPEGRCLLLAGFEDIYKAADHVPVILQYHPIGVEGIDHNFVRNMRKAGLYPKELDLFPEGEGWLLIEFGGQTAAEAEIAARKLEEVLKTAKAISGIRIFPGASEQKKIWAIRESSFGATVFVPGIPDTFSGFEDSAVPPEKLGAYLRDLQKIYDKYNYYAVTYGHFGDGCIHSRISFDLKTDDGIRIYRNFLEEATDLVLKYGGSFSGEHGDGQTWGEFLPKMYGEELVEAFRQFKKIWDPENKMNPGKVIAGYKVDDNLRLRPYSTIPQPELYFEHDAKNFARTTERCIGIGKCLKKGEGIMCPSYMVTGEEMHSTRGRAHLLHEMMRGEAVKGGWKDEGVKESLDLCLACKGCKTECPVGVDMAAYKAEFLSHYYKGRLRPLRAYAFGLIAWWARLATLVPGLANGFMRIPGVKTFVKKLTGIASQREIPEFPDQTFRQWFAAKETDYGLAHSRGDVILWPDTFNNYFYPETAKAAAEVLETLGYRVRLPQNNFCCGRPLYDYGMLGLARKFLKDIMAGMRADIEKGTPIVCLEPSCAAVFRDELKQLFPGDETANKLSSNVLLLAEFLEKDPEALKRFHKSEFKGILHGHCHQKVVMGMGAEERLVAALGLDLELLKTGCCGMAGAFGFEEKHYPVSMQVGELGVLPAARKVSGEGMIVTDGFSCREQIRQGSGKKPLHLAELLRKML